MRRWTALLLSLALLLVPGCQKEAERSSLPKLELHREEEKDYLLLEGVRYNRVSTETVDNRYAGCWRFAGETGEFKEVFRTDGPNAWPNPNRIKL